MKHNQAVTVLLLLILIYTAVFATLHIVRYRAFFSHDWRDEAVDNQIIYNSANGHPVFSTIKGDMIFHRHFRPMFLIAAIPWLIYDDIATWFVTVSLMLALGALAVYGIARHWFRSVPLAFGFAVLYLLWPPLHEITLGNYDPETFVATFWLFAALYYEKERPVLFWFFVALALFCKETQAAVLFGFGLMALVRRKGVKWWAPMFVVGPAYFLLCLKVIIPLYYKTFGTIYGRFIGCGQNDAFPVCFLQSLISEPVATLGQVFRREHVILMKGVFRATLLFAFAGIEWLLPALAIFAEVLLLNEPFPIRQAHILSGMLPFVFLASMSGTRKIAGLAAFVSKNPTAERWALRIALGLFFIAGILFSLGPGLFGQGQTYGNDHEPELTASSVFSKENFDISDADRQAWESIALIPKDATVMTNSRFLLALSSRHRLLELGTQNNPADFDAVSYILVSFTEPKCRTCTYTALSEKSLGLLRDLVVEGRFKVVRLFEDHALLVRYSIAIAPIPDAIERFSAAIEDKTKSLPTIPEDPETPSP